MDSLLRQQRQFSAANSHLSVVWIKSRTEGGAEAPTSGINGIKSCHRSTKQFYSLRDFLTPIVPRWSCQQDQISLGSTLGVNTHICF